MGAVTGIVRGLEQAGDEQDLEVADALAPRTRASKSSWSAAWPRRSWWCHWRWTACASLSMSSSSGMASGWPHAFAHARTSASVGICRPFSIFGTLERGHPSKLGEPVTGEPGGLAHAP